MRDDTCDNMNSPSPLDTMDPNILSRRPTGKSQAAEQAIPRALPPIDYNSSEAPISDSAASAAGSLMHVTRPSLTGIASFQRPRKRVLWRNKACFIALPLEDEFGRKTSRETYLGRDDFQTRLEKWKDQGFDTNGFTLLSPSSASNPLSEGQSRTVHPDPEDVKRERADGIYHVNIPERRHWETYVNHLKEAKVRALGVDEQIQRNSPAPTIMSRQGSSQSSVILTSPTLAPSPHVGPFHPSFYGAANSAISAGKPGISHFPTYPTAHGFFTPSLVSPSQSPRPQETQIPEPWSPQTHLVPQQGLQLASPQIYGHMQKLGHAAPSVPPAVLSNVGQVSDQASNGLLARMEDQQALLQMHQLQQQQNCLHQQQILQQRLLPSVRKSQDGEPILQPVVNHNQNEISSSIPHDHRQNPSENFEGESDEARAYASYSTREIEGHEGVRVTQIDEGHREHEANNTSNNAEKKVPHIAGAMGSTLDTGPRFRGVADHETNRRGQFPKKYSSKTPRFNVNAPKFEPRNYQNPNVFSFLGHQQVHKVVKSDSLSISSIGLGMQAHGEASQPSKWNAEAPAFMPKAPLITAIPSREFSFSALRPSFRPDAPAFTPTDSRKASESGPSSERNAVLPTNKIFGDIDIAEINKPRKSKAIPITTPHKEPESPLGSEEVIDIQEDESGRITQADGRQKRIRRERDNGHEVPLFAPTEEKSPCLDRGSENREGYASRIFSPESDALDATTVDAATELLEGLIDDLSATEASDIMQRDGPTDEDPREKVEYTFNDISEAATFNTARPPDPHEVTVATRDFLEKSPQFATAFNRALGHRTSISGSSCSSTKDERKTRECEPQGETEYLVDRINQVDQDMHFNIMSGVRYVEPSYNELDAVMKHLNTEDFELGVKRQHTPRSLTQSPIRNPSPKLHKPSTANHLVLPADNKSSTSYSSSKRVQGNHQTPRALDLKGAKPSLVEVAARSARYSPSYGPSRISTPIDLLHNQGSTPPSEWDESISSLNKDKIRSKTASTDRVYDIVEDIVQRNLKTLEQTLSGIQHSLTQFSDRSATRRSRRSGGLEIEHSDADDEDDLDEASQSRPKSPLRDRKLDRLKASLSEVAAAQQSFVQASQLTEMMAIVKELKPMIQEKISPSQVPGDIKNVVEEAVGRQMRGRSAPVTSSSQAAAAEKSQLQIVGLESMLKIANTRANDEMQARRSVEDELADKARSLRIALHEASEQRESAEATERSLRDFHTERQQALQRTAMLEGSLESMRKSISDLSEKNTVLEETLAEYRLSSDQWRSEINEVKHENQDLRRITKSLNAEIEENVQARQALRVKIDHLQEQVNMASRSLASDHMTFLSKEEEHKARLEILSARLEAEAQTRERLRLEIERIEVQERDYMKTQSMAERLQNANGHLEKLLAELRSECHDHQRVIARLREQIDLINADADRSRSHFELLVKETSDSRSAALAEDQRLLDNAFEDKQRSETYFKNQLNLADEKLVHYQDRVSHLEEKLEIARSAAHAAVQAAQSKKAVLGLSLPNTSPPTIEASDRGALPEKISPQALRESILVLQEQLQERETRIEQLEHRLSSIDTNAPERLKDAEIEITWLRELLEIRTEDLDDLIATVSQPFYNPDSVKDAAIRLKASLQMEQQEKERAIASFPSLARISDIAASPKSLPLAAAAAWANWRKGRESAIANQTPSKSSPQTFFAGLMTPPSTEMWTVPPSGDSRMHPSSPKRLFRAPTKPKQDLPTQEDRLRRRQPEQYAATPPLMRNYNLDANEGTFDGNEVSNKMVGNEETLARGIGTSIGRM